MLSALSINNIVLIERLDLELSSGLTVLSGETGAGKSILLDALTLALGGRGDLSLVRKGQQSGFVVAEIFLPDNHLAFSILKEAQIEYSEQLILKRVQFSDGRTRAFINDQPVSASLLRKIGSKIIEIHGQHDDRALVDVATHRKALDDFGALNLLSLKVQQAHEELVELEEKLNRQIAKIEKAKQDEEYARHVVEELSNLALEGGEDKALSEQRQRLMQLEKAASDIKDIDEILHRKNAPAPALASLMRKLSRKNDEAGLFSPIIEALDTALLSLDRTSEALETLKHDLNFDPNELENIEERLFSLRETARKHHVSVEQLPQILEKYEAELKQLESGESELAKLKKATKKAHDNYIGIATKLSEKRQKISTLLEKAVGKELPDLKLGAAKFIVEHKIEQGKISFSGFDNIAFHVQTNPGTNAGPLLKVASGGELSRFLLALKVVLAEKGSAPVLIFDEIDSGVGGAVADAIGRRLARLAQNVQVFSITHAPQVAARANIHLLIEKQMIDENMRTNVRQLNIKQRQEELARMLAGAKVSDEARAAAMHLLEQN
ncbi:MAG: DNA repair protein RecN [Devosiaceae bacterium]|nr:DNA repair protein RecN [Devosiaceae bacterium]